MKRYVPLWQRFVQWCKERELPFLPSTGTVVALYLLAIAQTGKSQSSIKCNSAAISAFHEFSSFGKVTDYPLVCAVRNYARRVLPSGENRKEPITWEKVEQANLWLAHNAQSMRNLSLATAISLGFCGFFRYDDLAHIRVSNLKLVGESLLEIRLDSRKTDQYRAGSLIVLSAIESYSCPVKSVALLLQRAGLTGTSRPLFSAVSVRDGVEMYGNTPASYQYLRRGILEAFEAVGLPAKEFGLHSLRAGGATQAANQGIPDRLWMEHGGWKSQRSAFGYVKTSSEVKAGVTQAMFPSLQP